MNGKTNINDCPYNLMKFKFAKKIAKSWRPPKSVSIILCITVFSLCVAVFPLCHYHQLGMSGTIPLAAVWASCNCAVSHHQWRLLVAAADASGSSVASVSTQWILQSYKLHINIWSSQIFDISVHGVHSVRQCTHTSVYLC